MKAILVVLALAATLATAQQKVKLDLYYESL